MKTLFFQIGFLIILGAISRLVPHPWNFTALGAVSLFAGALSGSWLKSLKTTKAQGLVRLLLTFFIPFSVLFLTDLYFGFYDGMVFTYLSAFLVSILGWMWNPNTGERAFQSSSSFKGLSLAMVGSVIFFLVSNYSVYRISGMYTQNLEGLFMCYVMALPFFHWQILGDVFFFSVISFVLSFHQQVIVLGSKEQSPL